MGDVISLAAHPRFRVAEPAREQESGLVTAEVVFAFDLSSPFTYLAADRVERHFARVEWRPVLAGMAALPERPDAYAEERAAALGLPLVWPDRFGPATAAMRVASLAAERGCARAFVLAAGRLAFCGGFDLDDPDVIAEAAAVAQLGLDDALAAAGDSARDEPMREAARRLAAQGADRFPLLCVDGTMFAGEDRLAAAVAAFAGVGEDPSPVRYSGS